MPTVENFTPAMLWTTIYGMLCLCILFIVVYKVYEAIVKIIDRHNAKKESAKPDFAEAVSKKVIEKLEPRFKKIEEALNEDKDRLDEHDAFISEVKDSQKETNDGLVAICNYLMAIVQFGNISSDTDEMKKATSEMNKFLAMRIGGKSK
jgi:predicted  nucleic acid-binding Zn-ribbon protein